MLFILDCTIPGSFWRKQTWLSIQLTLIILYCQRLIILNALAKLGQTQKEEF